MIKEDTSNKVVNLIDKVHIDAILGEKLHEIGAKYEILEVGYERSYIGGKICILKNWPPRENGDGLVLCNALFCVGISSKKEVGEKR